MINQIINNPWVPVGSLLVLGLFWIVAATIYQISLQNDIAIGHSEWPQDLKDLKKIIVEIDLPVPIPRVNIYSQVVAKFNMDPLGV